MTLTFFYSTFTNVVYFCHVFFKFFLTFFKYLLTFFNVWAFSYLKAHCSLVSINNFYLQANSNTNFMKNMFFFNNYIIESSISLTLQAETDLSVLS